MKNLPLGGSGSGISTPLGGGSTLRGGTPLASGGSSRSAPLLSGANSGGGIEAASGAGTPGVVGSDLRLGLNELLVLNLLLGLQLRITVCKKMC